MSEWKAGDRVEAEDDWGRKLAGTVSRTFPTDSNAVLVWWDGDDSPVAECDERMRQLKPIADTASTAQAERGAGA